MKPRKPLPPRRSFLARSPIRKHGRTPSETERIYGPPERGDLVRAMPCAACGVEGYSENAHVVKGDKGMGHKASARFTAPLCGSRYDVMGCHRLFDDYRWTFDTKHPDFDPDAAAAATEAAWQRTLAREIL